jgi:hypothetical protein
MANASKDPDTQLNAHLDALLASFLETQPAMPESQERPFAYEPFALPIRGFAESLQGYDAEVAALEAMDAPPLVPIFLEEAITLPTGAIDTCNLADAGANVTTQLAALLRRLRAHNWNVNHTPEIFWQCGLGGHVWENLGLMRAGKALVYAYFASINQPVFVLKISAVGLATSMTEADGYTNLLRLSTEALTAHMAGVEYLYLPAFAAKAPGLEELRQRIHAVAEHESRVHAYGAAQKGAYWPTLLGAKLMQATHALADSGADLTEEADKILAQKKADVATGKRVWVGQTQFANPALTIAGPHAPATAEWV